MGQISQKQIIRPKYNFIISRLRRENVYALLFCLNDYFYQLCLCHLSLIYLSPSSITLKKLNLGSCLNQMPG